MLCIYKKSYRCRQSTQGSIYVIVAVVRHALHLSSGSQSGILSALPFASACIFIVPGGLLADFLLSRKILRLNTIRKLFTAIGKNWSGYRGWMWDAQGSFLFTLCSLAPAVLLPAVLFTSVFWVRSSFSTAIAFLTISSAFKSFAQSGALVNFMDIAPR